MFSSEYINSVLQERRGFALYDRVVSAILDRLLDIAMTDDHPRLALLVVQKREDKEAGIMRSEGNREIIAATVQHCGASGRARVISALKWLYVFDEHYRDVHAFLLTLDPDLVL